MSEYQTIEIDFDVHKLIENERSSFAESKNDALRRLLKLPVKTASKPVGESSPRRSWSGEGVALPHGTAVRMRYNGRLYEGVITDGEWIIEGKTLDRPSGAASGVAVTKRGKRTRLDGWVYWEVRRPGNDAWLHISKLRRGTLTPEDLGL